MVWLAVISVGLAFVLSDLIKIILSRGKWRPFELGGMPSTHSAIVSSLVVSVWFETGFSLLFLLAAVFGMLVVRDACGVRWEVSRHSAVLNTLTKKNHFKVAGHTVIQALAGVVLGVVVATAVYLVGRGM